MWLENKQNPYFFDRAYRNGACVFAIFAAIFTMIIAAATTSSNEPTSTDDQPVKEESGSTLYIICLITILLSYASMFIEAYFSKTLQQLRSIKTLDEVRNIVNQGKDECPHIYFELKNYHYSKDADGKELKLKPRIITGRERGDYIFREWTDRTKPEGPL